MEAQLLLVLTSASDWGEWLTPRRVHFPPQERTSGTRLIEWVGLIAGLGLV